MNIEKLKKLFTKYPAQEQFYVTSDGQVFFTEHDARGQASALRHAAKSDEVTPALRTDIMGDGLSPTLSKGEGGVTAVTDAQLTPLEKALADNNATASNLAQAQAALDDAKAKLAAAITAKENVPADATTRQKSELTRAVTNANKLVADAQADADNAQLTAIEAAEALAALTTTP